MIGPSRVQSASGGCASGCLGLSCSRTSSLTGITVDGFLLIHFSAADTCPLSINLEKTLRDDWFDFLLSSLDWIVLPSLRRSERFPSSHKASLLARHSACSLDLDDAEGFCRSKGPAMRINLTARGFRGCNYLYGVTGTIYVIVLDKNL